MLLKKDKQPPQKKKNICTTDENTQQTHKSKTVIEKTDLWPGQFYYYNFDQNGPP